MLNWGELLCEEEHGPCLPYASRIMEYRANITDVAAAADASAAAAAAVAPDDDESYHGTPHIINIEYLNSSVIKYAYYILKSYLSVCNYCKYFIYILVLIS